ncbi:unnamed protein product [Amoebophrya sp. A120]|nr:unnamed protein product [Amoebophrya sp. A120]|eukprot:GSA120T00017064001.1
MIQKNTTTSSSGPAQAPQPAAAIADSPSRSNTTSRFVREEDVGISSFVMHTSRDEEKLSSTSATMQDTELLLFPQPQQELVCSFKKYHYDFHVHEISQDNHEARLTELHDKLSIRNIVEEEKKELKERKARFFVESFRLSEEEKTKIGLLVKDETVLRKLEQFLQGEQVVDHDRKEIITKQEDEDSMDLVKNEGAAASPVPSATARAATTAFLDLELKATTTGTATLKETRKTFHELIRLFFADALSSESSDLGQSFVRVWRKDLEKQGKQALEAAKEPAPLSKRQLKKLEKGAGKKGNKGAAGKKGTATIISSNSAQIISNSTTSSGAAGTVTVVSEDQRSTAHPLLAATSSSASFRREPWPQDRPDYLSFLLYKENKDTAEAIQQISRAMHMDQRPRNVDKFGFAGTKDRRGCTTQFCTLYRTTEYQLLKSLFSPAFDRKQVFIQPLGYVKDKLQLGMLKGNRFDVLLRDLELVMKSSTCNVSVARAEENDVKNAAVLEECTSCKISKNDETDDVAMISPTSTDAGGGAVMVLPDNYDDGNEKTNLREDTAAVLVVGLQREKQNTSVEEGTTDLQALKAFLTVSFQNLSTNGFLNYFGLQRFGTGTVRTHTIGAFLLSGEYEKAMMLLLGAGKLEAEKDDHTDEKNKGLVVSTAAVGGSEDYAVNEVTLGDGPEPKRRKIDEEAVLFPMKDEHGSSCNKSVEELLPGTTNNTNSTTTYITAVREKRWKDALFALKENNNSRGFTSSRMHLETTLLEALSGCYSSTALTTVDDVGEGEAAVATNKSGKGNKKGGSKKGKGKMSSKTASTITTKPPMTDPRAVLEQLPRESLSLYYHALQSFCFNKVLSRRAEIVRGRNKGTGRAGAEIVAGDLVLLTPVGGNHKTSTTDKTTTGKMRTETSNGGDEEDEDQATSSIVHTVTEEEVLLKTYTAEDVVLPLPGYEVQYPEYLRGVYDEVLSELGGTTNAGMGSDTTLDLSLASFGSSVVSSSSGATVNAKPKKPLLRNIQLNGAYRHVIVKPKEVSWELVNTTTREAAKGDEEAGPAGSGETRSSTNFLANRYAFLAEKAEIQSDLDKILAEKKATEQLLPTCQNNDGGPTAAADGVFVEKTSAQEVVKVAADAVGLPLPSITSQQQDDHNRTEDDANKNQAKGPTQAGTNLGKNKGGKNNLGSYAVKFSCILPTSAYLTMALREITQRPVERA